jgi:hypothetical protein
MDKFPAIPPNDYKGTIADWIVNLVQLGFWDEENPEWYGDVELSEEQYDELLTTCERK